MASSDILRDKVATANRILAYTGLASGIHASLGHASARDTDTNHVYIKGRGYAVDSLARMRPSDLVTVDLDAKWIAGPPGIYPPHEVKMHTQIYRAHPEVMGVVHTHASTCVLLSVLNTPIRPMSNDGGAVVVDGVPLFESNVLISTDELGDSVVEAMGTATAVLLRGHGAITIGRSVEEATMNMIYLEEQAKLNYQAYVAAGKDHPSLSPADIEAHHRSLEQLSSLGWLKQQRRHEPKRVADRLWPIYAEMVSLG